MTIRGHRADHQMPVAGGSAADVEVHAEEAGDRVQRQGTRGQHGQRAHDVVGAWPSAEKCICTATSAECSSRRTCVSAFDVLQHVARATRNSSRSRGAPGRSTAIRPVRRSTPAPWRCAGPRRSLQHMVQRVARIEQRRQSPKRLRVEQAACSMVQVARQQAAQFQVAVDHVVDHAQHQVRPGCRGRRPLPRCRRRWRPAPQRGEDRAPRSRSGAR